MKRPVQAPESNGHTSCALLCVHDRVDGIFRASESAKDSKAGAQDETRGTPILRPPRRMFGEELEIRPFSACAASARQIRVSKGERIGLAIRDEFRNWAVESA
jgi:hypothetical protein